MAGTHARPKVLVAVISAAVVAGAMLATPWRASAAGIAFNSLVKVGAFGGEPSITSDSNGVLWDTTPSGLPPGGGDPNAGSHPGQPPIYRSNDKGLSWHQIQPATSSSGDDCLATDQSNALYWCNLADPASTAPLQATSYRTTVGQTCVASCSWLFGAGSLPSPLGSPPPSLCGTSCDPFGVDRQWEDGWVPPAVGSTTAPSGSGAWCMDTSQTPPKQPPACAVLMYHDFYGPSNIWVNISTDGAAHFSAPINVLAHLNPFTASVGGVLGTFNTFCNTVPAGTNIVKSGPHAGRIYAGWLAADPVQNTSGCNITMLQSFHNLVLAWSDDGGNNWTVQVAFDGGVGHDASSPFAGFTIDRNGNPYFAFTMNRWFPDPTANEANISLCHGYSLLGQQEMHQDICAYDMYIVWSSDGGNTWDGGGGLVPGSAGAPYKVNPSSENGTHLFPAIAVANPGQVDVAYLRTPDVIPTGINGKALPGGCAGPGPGNGNPATYPGPCPWNLFAAQSLDLSGGPSSTTWSTTQVTSVAMHVGDICNLGIFCTAPASDRTLLDFIQETIDPTTGCAHIAYADNNGPDSLAAGNALTADTNNPSPNENHLVVANQTDGCLGSFPTVTPEAPWAAMLLPVGVAAGAVGWAIRRRRNQLIAA